MTVEEKPAMKAACMQAAATLIAARDSGKDQIDVEGCVKLAALLYVRVVTTDWREAAQHTQSQRKRFYRLLNHCGSTHYHRLPRL